MAAIKSLMACITFALTFTAAQSASYLGTELVFGILPSLNNGTVDAYDVYLEISSKEAGSMALTIPHFQIYGKQYTLQQNGYQNITIDRSIQVYNNLNGKYGLSIQSTVDISVLVTSAFNPCCNIVSYRVFPVPSLGNHYIAASHNPTGRDIFDDYLMVVGVEDNTKLSIQQPNSTVVHETLNELQVYQIKYPVENVLTGTTITTDKHVAVFSGSAFASPIGYAHGIAMHAQMIPRAEWDDTFIVTPGEPINACLVRVVSDNQNVSARAIGSYTSQAIHINTVQDIAETYMVKAQDMIELVQYNDEFMTLVPGISHYMNEYSFVLPVLKSRNLTHALKAIVPSNQNGDIFIDGKPFDGVESTLDTPHGQYSVFLASTSEGFHHVVHTNVNVKFGLLAFGWSSDYSSTYGFYVGMEFNAHRTCYSCHDMDQLMFCDVVQRCAKNQVCYVKKHSVGGYPIYSSGCMDNSICNAMAGSSQDSCTECCSGDFCNNHGCGDSGMPPRNLRGPVCFECQHISSPERCPTLTICDQNQECAIEEFKWGSVLQYKLGCDFKACTPAKRGSRSDNERASHMVPVRRSCCTSDYCNRNITVLNTESTGIGIIG